MALAAPMRTACAGRRCAPASAGGVRALPMRSRAVAPLRRSLRVRAEGEESQDKAPEATPTKDEAKSVEAAKIKKGQNTAIWTGAVSIGFGVLYLVLVLLLDTRGSVLEPPPPEALGL